VTHDEVQSHILAVRRGPGANCSSIGSAVEMLFLSATAGVAIVAAVSAALRPHDDDDPPPETPPVEAPPAPPSADP
jgi:hypothetical protein